MSLSPSPTSISCLRLQGLASHHLRPRLRRSAPPAFTHQVAAGSMLPHQPPDPGLRHPGGARSGALADHLLQPHPLLRSSGGKATRRRRPSCTPRTLGYHFNQLHFFGHCDGLVLVPTPTPASTSSTRPHQGRHHPCRKPAGGHDEARGCYCVGLGLDPRIGKYKVVQGFYRSADRTTMGMQVYTIAHRDDHHHLGSCCWRDIRNDPPYLPQRGQTALSIKGYLFWRVAEPPQQQQQRRALLHLSLEDEEFGITKLPPPDSSEDPSSPDRTTTPCCWTCCTAGSCCASQQVLPATTGHR